MGSPLSNVKRQGPTLKRSKLRTVSLVAAIVAVLSFIASALPASAYDANPERATASTPAYATYPLKPNSVGSSQLTDNGIGKPDLGPVLRNEIFNGIAGATNKANAADAKAQSALDAIEDLPQAPVFLDGWGEIHRNVIGDARAELETQSTGGGALSINTGNATSKTHFGTETMFAGKRLGAAAGYISYEVLTNGENTKKSATGNMPSIIFEIDPHMFYSENNPIGYASLVYSPGNTPSGEWTTVNATTDTGKHWGLTGKYFNGSNDYPVTPEQVNERCGINGNRCTLSEALSALSSEATILTFGVSKGRDFEFHGAVRTLTIGQEAATRTFKFTANGVVEQ